MGEIAAFFTAVCWSFSSIFFSNATREVGAIVVNRLRLLMAVFLLILTHQILQNQPLPLEAGLDRWFWLGLSGFVGLIIGDIFLFQAYAFIGPRLSMLMMSLAPVISAVLAWLFLHEALRLGQIAGILVTVLGIAMVVSDKGNGPVHLNRRNFWLGICCGFGGAAGQAGGLILAKKGLYDNFPAISGVTIRMVVAVVIMWLLTMATRKVTATWREVRARPRAIQQSFFGAIVGPFIGVWLSLVAVQHSQVGVASTLMALPPVIMLPIAHWGFKEHISRRAIFGTVLSMLGIGVLFLAP